MISSSPSRPPASNLVDGRICNVEPATGRAFPPLPVTAREEVFATVRRAHEAQARWAGLSWQDRERKLLDFRRLLVERSEELVELLAKESGKPRVEALTHEIFPIADLTGFFAKRAKKILADESIGLHLFGPMKRSWLRYEPRGVIGVISPWNFPFSIPMGDVVMALAARNAVVVKPSEWTPRILLEGKKLMEEAGIDTDLFGVVLGGAETGQALLDAGIDMMIFTGSVATGRKVGAACGERLLPYVAELGGKDPAIVLDDVKIDTVARQIVWGAFANSGQVCASVERVLVHDSVYENFVEAVVAHASSLRQGDPAQGHVDVGAMVVPGQLEKVREQVEQARALGARILVGGKARCEGDARFFEPTVLVDVPREAAIWREETFGPCLPIRRFSDEEEAVREANDSPFGLSAYVFSSSVSRAERIASRLQAGTVMVNDVLYTHALPETPWGGVKQSGIGRVHGLQGLKDLCEIRHVNQPRISMTPMWMYPYGEKTYRFFHGAMRKLFKGPFS